MPLTHVDDQGRARMVDVTQKEDTHRVAIARGEVLMQPETLRLVAQNQIAKGDVLTVAQVAGIMAAKQTFQIIPMCHPLMLTGIDVRLTLKKLQTRWRSRRAYPLRARREWRWKPSPPSPSPH